MNVIQFGLGPIGVQVLGSISRSKNLDLVGAVDIDPKKAGKDVGTFLHGEKTGIEVVTEVQQLPKEVAELTEKTAIHAAGSDLEQVWAQLKELLDAGFSVVSTCEELAYPWRRYPELSREIDQYARERELSVLGTGVNPGFVMDVLPLCLTAVTDEVFRVSVSRFVDVSRRRLPLQKKVGVGLKRDVFEQLAEEGEIGHVGLEESVRLVAYGLEWELDELTNSIEPTVSGENASVALTELEMGDVDGLHQLSVGRTRDGKEIGLDLTMRARVEQRDEVVIEGSERQHLLIPEGISGDTATAAMAINCAKMIGSAGRGLLTMADVKLPRHA